MVRMDVAYLLWLVGGPLGLHHLYLGDDYKALLFAVTGGGFLVAWLRDVWCIPSYVRQRREANLDSAVDPKKKSFFLLVALWGVSTLFGRLATLALAPAWATPFWWEVIVRACACSVAVYLVAHSGYHRTFTRPFYHLLGVALLVQLVYFFVPTLDQYAWASMIPGCNTATALATSVYAYKFRRFAPKAEKEAPRICGSQSCCLSSFLVAICACTMLLCLPMAFLWNASVEVDGEKVLLVQNFSNFYETAQADDWRTVLEAWILSFREIEQFTRQGVDRIQAYETLGLKEGASMHEVKRRFRNLAKELHPDKHDSSQRKQYEEKFAKVQQAYHALVERFGRDQREDL